jgi:predicted ATPase
VCYEGAAAQEAEALDTLFCLVDKSLLLQEEGREGQLRFGMLGTIRAYAQEQLIKSGEAAQIERRHALYYLGLVETAVAQIGAVEDDVWQAPLAQEHDNVRAAFSWVQRRREQEPELYWPFFEALWNSGLGWRLARAALTGMLG